MNVCEGANERPRDANVDNNQGTRERERWVTPAARVMEMQVNGSSWGRGREGGE